MRTKRRLIVAGAAAPLLLLAANAAALDDAKPPAGPTAPADASASPAPPVSGSAAGKPADDLSAEVERIVGKPVHGDLTLRFLGRWAEGTTDQQFFEYLNLRVGDETKDRVSGTLFVRAIEDVTPSHKDDHTFNSLNDTFDGRVNALLYTAYATIRPVDGVFESVRIGRQYVFATETFHVDGASGTTRPLVDSIKLKLTAYGGIPVHFYESSARGDWLGGIRFEADPWKGGRAAVDYVHDQDEFSVISEGTAKNDLAALSMWQNVAKNLDLYGQFAWLDGPRDGTLRATWSLPDDELTVQGSYYRLLETKQQFATEFDPYYDVIADLVRYQQAELRVAKGFGKKFDVEVGGSVRRLLSGETVGAFNRDAERVYATPTVTDLLWDGNSISVTGESLSGDGEQIKTWAGEISQKFGKKYKASVGSDYSLYAFGPLKAADERSHVRTVYLRFKASLTESLSADLRYTWEKDDVETFHVLSLALVLVF